MRNANQAPSPKLNPAPRAAQVRAERPQHSRKAVHKPNRTLPAVPPHILQIARWMVEEPPAGELLAMLQEELEMCEWYKEITAPGPVNLDIPASALIRHWQYRVVMDIVRRRSDRESDLVLDRNAVVVTGRSAELLTQCAEGQGVSMQGLKVRVIAPTQKKGGK